MRMASLRTLLICLLLGVVTIPGQDRNRQKDGPLSVDVFEKDEIKIEAADLSKLPALPHGYSAIPQMAYRITTEVEGVGPYTVLFGVPSITARKTFDSLRVLHAEVDEFDPDSTVWIDRTITGSDEDAPDFSR